MEFILLFVIVLQFAYIIYKDQSFGVERERMQLKIMSKDVTEYKGVTEKEPEDSEAEEGDVLVPIEEASVEEVVTAKGI